MAMVTIRHCTKEEAPELQKLNDEVFIGNAKYDTDLDLNWAKSEKGSKYFNELLNDNNALCLIAEDGDRKIGYLAAAPKEIDYRNSKYVEIQNMGVNPDYRSQGIGKRLMEQCFEWARSMGFQKVFVTSYIQNKGAVDFYKNNGFDEIDISLEKTL